MILKAILTSIVFLLLSANTYGADNDLAKAQQLFESKKYNIAKVDFQKLLKATPNNSLIHYYLGRIEHQQQNFEQAGEMFDKSLEISPEHANTWFWKSMNYFEQTEEAGFFSIMGLLKKGRKALEKTIILDPNHIKGLSYLSGFYARVPGLAGGDIDKSKQLANRLVKLDKTAGSVALLRIMVEENNGDIENEYAKTANMVGNNPEYADFYNDYGYFFLEDKKYDAAINQFLVLTQLAPKDANSFDSLGEGYLKAGKLAQAKNAFEKALQISPEFESSEQSLKKVIKKLKKKAR